MVTADDLTALAAWAGATLATGGAAWAAWAAACLRGAGNPLAPGADPQVMVDHGPYRFGRHPMYLGLALVGGGLALALASPTLAAGTALFAFSAQRLWIPAEEARLRRAFGGWYSDYMSDVRPWV